MHKKNNLNIKLKPIFAGILSSIICCVTMINLSSFLFVQSKYIPNFALGPLNLIILSLSTFLSGYVSGHLSKNKGIIYGLLCGTIIFTIIFVGGIVMENSTITYNLLLKGILIMLFSVSGGVFGVNIS